MSGRNISSPKSGSGNATSRPAGASRTVLNDHYIHRIAVDKSAVLGSFYDARTERVLHKLSLGKTPIIKTSKNKAVDCIIMKDDIYDSEDIFRRIGIHDEPWLNSILNIIPAEGIPSLVNYPFSKSTNTRFLYYYYSSEEQSISHDKNTVKIYIPKVIPDITATHVISTTKVGMQALIVLQLSSNDATNLDCLLDNIAQQLIKNKFQVSKDEKPLFDRITVTKIFSNIPDLKKKSTLADICENITRIKPHIYRHFPLEFTLCTIHWFYPSYPKEKAKYIPLEPECIKIIKQYLLSLSSQIKELNTSLDSKDKQTLEGLDAYRQQIADVEKMYSVEIERIRDLVIKIRSGIIRQDSITETLTNTSKQSLQSTIDLIIDHFRSLREKEQLINKFEKPMGRPTSPNISNKERTPSQERSISVNEQQKGSKSPSPSMPQFTLKPHKQSKEIEELPSSSPMLDLENMYSQKEQRNSVDESSNLSTTSSPQPLPRKTIQSTDAEHLCNPPRSTKISTTENITPSNEETKHVKEQCKMPESSKVLPPPVSPRMKHQNSNLSGPIMPTTPLKSSTAKQTFVSEEKPDSLNEHDNILGSSAKSTSDATRPLKEQLDDGKKPSKSANLSISLNKQSSKIEKTMKRSSSSSNLSDTKRISSYEKQPLKKDEHPKSPTSLTRSNSDISLTVKQKSEDNKELFNSSISSKRSDVENTSSRTKQLVSVEDSTNRSRSSTPSIPRSSSRQRRTISRTNSILNSTSSSNSSTVESTALSKEKSHSEKEPSDMSHPPIILTPKAALRTKQKYINDQEPLNDRTSLKLSSVNRTFSSENQLDHPAKHESVSGSSSKLALDASQPRKEQSEGREKQLELSSLPTSSNVESIQSSNKLVEEIREPFSSSTQSNLLNAEETSPQDKQCAHLNEQSKSPTSVIRSSSDISLIVKQENEDNNESLNSLISPKRLDIKNTSPRTLQFASLEDLTHQSRSSTPQPSPRERRRSANTKNQFDITETLNSSTAESAALSNGQSNLSHSPKILTPQAIARAKQDSINNNEPLNRQTLLKLSATEQTTKSEEISKSTVEQVSSPKSSPIPSPETSQQTEKQSEDTEEQSAQLKPPQLLSTEHALSSEQYLNQAKKQSDIQSSQMLSTSEVTTREGHRPNSSRLSAGKYINILLLGESGVGKSTFINALVNYHAFETFEQARSNKPLVVMPVSFLMTVGDNFEEKIVKFGDVDSNENHNHLGQSVTQHCRSYVFPISAQSKLRIIDTPGMGDTRGLEQDDLNMQHILAFINNLSHLNAICILLKPNESRLNIVLRSYFTGLLNFLGENARNNIVFCFTNTRATFFAPGNTGPLLKNMIKNVPIKDIPFEKTNTFCFDSESFRYLVALQNGIEFDSYQQTEYQQSWKSSVTESNRLLQYICGELGSYSQNEWQSIEHAQFKINQIIRPMLETTRNIVRNTTLLKKSLSNLLIKLCPTALSEPSAICYTCPRTPERFSKFWILSDDLHTFSDKCNNCDCSRRKHIEVNYKLEYELTQNEGEQSFDIMMNDFNQLRRAVLEVSQFYAYVVNTLKQNDPMLSALEQIIAEESQICSEKGSKYLNSTLHNLFVGLIEEYKERRTISASIDLPVDLPSVYELIKDISEIGEIKEQIYAIKQTQKKYMKRQEKQVS